ncbi:Plug domain-containing protein [Nevskia sp.]|uniref:Plug domain-containing protein n=1 Tax=Nevskia sp. TaxID=1929292 RepID=UPI0025D417E7|nr:Plug domain-containing protein [Nevskia sp.]
MPTTPCRRKPIALAAALMAAGSLWSAPAAAQETAESATAEEAVKLAPVLVEGTFKGPIENTAGTARQLTAETIEELKPVPLHEALRSLPGLRMIDDDIAGRRSGIGLRGAPSRRSRKVLLLEDGYRSTPRRIWIHRPTTRRRCSGCRTSKCCRAPAM